MTSDLSEPSLSSNRLTLFLDYSVIDHLHKIQTETYKGAYATPLQNLRTSAENQRIDIWIAEITRVEMLHGIEKIKGNEERYRYASNKDKEKLAIVEGMFARTLGYPCSNLDDNYSRLDISFRIAGPDAERANALQTRLLTVSGISRGDARQLVSCAFPFDGDNVTFYPKIDWFIAEDWRLINAVKSQMEAGRFPELAHLRFGSSAAVVAAHPALFGQVK